MKRIMYYAMLSMFVLLVILLTLIISTAVVYGAGYLLSLAFGITQITIFQSFCVAVAIFIIKFIV